MTGQLCSLVLLLLAFLSPILAQFEAGSPSISYSVNEGDSLTMTCSYSAMDVHTYTWQMNGQQISNTDGFTAGSSSLTIVSADHLRHTGPYTCVAILGDSDTFYADFNVTVNYIGSDIRIERVYRECYPDVGVAYIGSSFVLECVPPAGSPMVNVTWYRNGNKIRQRDDPTIDFSNSRRLLEINPVSTNATGAYHCEAANTINENDPLQTEDIHLTPQFLSSVHPDVRSVSIMNSSQSLPVSLGLNTEIVCKICPEVNINDVRWFYDGIHPIYTSDSIRIVQRSDLHCLYKLIFNNVTSADLGTYRCTFEGTGVTDYAERTLVLASLNGPLEVETTPSQVVGVGHDLTLVCQLSSTADPAHNNIPEEDFVYSWTHNGSEVESVEVSEGGRMLWVPEVDFHHSGRYQCLVSSPPNVVSSISAHADITVVGSAVIAFFALESRFVEQYGAKVHVELGATVTLVCSTHFTRSAHFTWYRANQVLESSSYQISSNSSSSSLILPRLTLLGLTDYHCQVDDSLHVQETLPLSLVEMQRLYIENAAAGRRGAEFVNGSSLKLACVTRGGAADSVRWLLGETQLTNQMAVGAGQVEIVTSGSQTNLTIYGVRTSETGVYACVIEDSGMESRREFSVTITVPGKILWTSDPMVTVVTGKKVQFDCGASGIPTPTVSWLYNSQHVATLDVPEIRDLGNGSVVVDHVTTERNGQYACYINNSQMLHVFTLRVEEGGEEDEGDGEVLSCGDFMSNDCIILLSGGSVAVVFLVLALLVFMVCVCMLCRRWRGRAYSVPRDLDAYEMKRADSSQASIRKDNGAVLTSSGANNFLSSNSYSKDLYPPSLPITAYRGSLLSDMQRSVTPPAPSPVLQTPGTGGTDSMFSSDDQSSLTASLPNFPRMQLQLGEEMGEGEFGPVILGLAKNIVSHEETTRVAVKVLVRSGDGDDQFQPDLALVDFANQMKMEYEHIACILGLCTDSEPYYVLYEYLDQGDLKKYLQTHCPVLGQPSLLTPHALSRLVLQVADGMAFLFSQRIIHGDLATRNCLISSEHRVKIADLGIGHDLYPTDYYDNGSQLLPIRWMPPELLAHTEDGPSFSLHSDIWSFGVLCWEVFSFAQLPYEGWADEEVLLRVPQGQLLSPSVANCPEHMRAVMRDCWDLDPEARPRFSKLCMDIMNIAEE